MITCVDFTTTAELGEHARSIEFIQIEGERKQALIELKQKFPWLDGLTVFYCQPTGILYVPANFKARK